MPNNATACSIECVRNSRTGCAAKPTEPLLITFSQAAELLGISRPTLYAWAKIDGFPVVRLGGCLRISMEGLRQWVQQQAEHSGGAV